LARNKLPSDDLLWKREHENDDSAVLKLLIIKS